MSSHPSCSRTWLPLATLAFALLLSGNARAIDPNVGWTDSYDVDGQCYCKSSFDHGAGDLIIDTPQGQRTARQVCETIGPGPGIAGNPVYNDLQCGHGPPNEYADETLCPGRVDLGEAGCFERGATWNLERWFPAPSASAGIAADAADAALPDEAANVLSWEAEAFETIDNRWVPIDSLSPGPSPGYDPDGPAADDASAGRYLELLPDQRVLSADDPGDTAAWTSFGAGPRLEHAVDFPQAGRWRVAVRLRSSGEHDERLAVGVDGSFADAGAALDACGQRDVWTWSSCREDSGWVDVLSAGVHTLQLAGIDDGVELDRVALWRIGDVPVARAPVVPAAPPAAPPSAPVTDASTDAAEPAARSIQAAPVVVGDGAAAAYGALSAVGLLLVLLLRWSARRRFSRLESRD